jgi:hypothetical protein
VDHEEPVDTSGRQSLRWYLQDRIEWWWDRFRRCRQGEIVWVHTETFGWTKWRVSRSAEQSGSPNVGTSYDYDWLNPPEAPRGSGGHGFSSVMRMAWPEGEPEPTDPMQDMTTADQEESIRDYLEGVDPVTGWMEDDDDDSSADEARWRPDDDESGEGEVVP